jgi:hypothetical protein
MTYVSPRLRRFIENRAAGRCEYCRLAQEGQEATFHIDHIAPRAAGGPTVANVRPGVDQLPWPTKQFQYPIE